MHELSPDDPVWTSHQPLTVGSMARALADSKTALAETRKLAEDVDDLDELIADIEKSTAEHRAVIKAVEARGKAFDDEIAKLRAAPDVLQKAMAWERGFFEKQWAASGSRVDFETYLAANRNRPRDDAKASRARRRIRQRADQRGAVQCSVSDGKMNAAEKLADATKRLRELREMAARLPEGANRNGTLQSIDAIAAELARGVADAVRRAK